MALVSEALDVDASDVLVSSTGVIGVRLNVEAIEAALPELVSKLEASEAGSDAVARAIMTTDTVKKEISYEFQVGGKTAHIGGISKGSGMIHPQMGTMLCYLTTDACVSAEMLDKALREVVGKTFNRISVDGDMSTNDTCIVLANGLAENPCIATEGKDFEAFKMAMFAVCLYLCRLMAKDGEGATHLMTCKVSGAATEQSAEVIGKSVINSSLTKAAIFGADANWGRVLCAMGYSGEDFESPFPSSPTQGRSWSVRTAGASTSRKRPRRKCCPRKRSSSTSACRKAQNRPSAGAATSPMTMSKSTATIGPDGRLSGEDLYG